VIRRATVADADAVADVFIPSFAGLTYLPRLHTEDDTRGWIRNVVLDQYEVWVAEEAGAIVGFAALSDDTLEQLYVHPEAQGKGLGAQLLEKAKEHRPNGFGLWVFQQNEGARRFYDRHGFRLVELTDGSRNEERVPDALYEWRP
jgi:GNAT superfamily N-acetyltransferase